jgi:glycosyltransferase involved in cell wall biosynthesis
MDNANIDRSDIMPAWASYWVLITVKNGETTITQTLQSILDQSIKPSLICIVDDGSKDSTPNILLDFKRKYGDLIHIITLPDSGYDIRRIVHNWNIACEFVKNSGKEFCYLLISSDDIIFSKEYVKSLLYEISGNPKLVVVSGSRGLLPSDDFSLPEGAGRLIKMSYLKQIGYRHPPYYGYEAWILYKALQMGYTIKKFNDIKYEHLRTFGILHRFVEYGVSMRCLGYHPMFVIARIFKNLYRNDIGIPKLASLKMLSDYFYQNKWKGDSYFQYFEPEVRSFVRSTQKKRLLDKIKKLF